MPGLPRSSRYTASVLPASVLMSTYARIVVGAVLSPEFRHPLHPRQPE
jgi:hypothetical protein